VSHPRIVSRGTALPAARLTQEQPSVKFIRRPAGIFFNSIQPWVSSIQQHNRRTPEERQIQWNRRDFRVFVGCFEQHRNLHFSEVETYDALSRFLLCRRKLNQFAS
jgi:hypothetical protein